MTQLFSNNAKTTLSAQVAVGATNIIVANGTGALYQSPIDQDYELVTITNGITYEIVKVTARTVDTLTVVRAQEGTTAKQWEVGESVSSRVTAGTMELVQQDILNNNALADTALLAVALNRPPAYDYGDQSANFTLDLALAETIRVRLTGDVTITLSNAVNGWATRLVIVQDGVGGHAFNISNIATWVAGMTPVYTVTANKTDILGIMYTDTTNQGTPTMIGMSYALDL